MTKDRKTRRILLHGTFDVFNYGDLLFPIIARARLAPHGFEVIPVSPTSAPMPLSDSIRPRAFEEIVQAGEDYDGVLIGGGNIIHNDASPLAAYREAGLAERAYAELWIGATLHAATRSMPVAWNAPGVMRGFDDEPSRALAAAVCRAASYIAVRDEASRSNLPVASDATPVEVVPDTALGLAEIWPRDQLLRVARKALARAGADPTAPTLTLHVKARSLGEMDVATLAASVEEVARRRGERVVLLALGPCHGDDEFARTLSRQLNVPHVLVDRPHSLEEIAAMIAGSRLYLGSSLHGYITACAYGTPARLVAVPELVKFRGFLAHVDHQEDACASWDEAFAACDTGNEPAVPPAAALARLEAHWDRVVASLQPQQVRGDAQCEFLRSAVKCMMKERTWPALFEAVAVRPKA